MFETRQIVIHKPVVSRDLTLFLQYFLCSLIIPEYMHGVYHCNEAFDLPSVYITAVIIYNFVTKGFNKRWSKFWTKFVR